MKNKIILVIGGARSGKSQLAEELARMAGEKRFYLATAPVCDAEMAQRVRLHQEFRSRDNWITIEEEINLVKALQIAATNGADSILIDCLTLWINNLLYHNGEFQESDIIPLADELVCCMRQLPIVTVLVINEVGLGLVPESLLARKFRDISGRCAQIIAKEADEVYFMVAGIKQRIK